MYMFLQYYRNFTPTVLKEFYEEDSILKEKEISMVSGREALRSASGMHSALNTTHHKLLEKPFKELPFGEIMEHFKITFQKVFVEERPVETEKYYLSRVSLIQIASTQKYDSLFTFTFTTDTTKEIDYISSPLVKQLVK